MSPRKATRKNAVQAPAVSPRRVQLAVVLDQIDDLEEEASLLFYLSTVLAEFGPRGNQPPARKILIDDHWVVPQRHVVARVQRMLSERSIEARARVRDLLLLEVRDDA